MRKVRCDGSRLQQQALPYSVPRNALEAKFSMPYCLAVALFDGDVGLERFDDESGLDPAVIEYCRRVVFSVHPDQQGSDHYGDDRASEFQEVVVRTTDGTELAERVYYARGHPRRPATDDELTAKFRRSVAGWLEDAEVDTLVQSVEGFEQLDRLDPVTAPAPARTSGAEHLNLVDVPAQDDLVASARQVGAGPSLLLHDDPHVLRQPH